jgi:hypothetical protein
MATNFPTDLDVLVNPQPGDSVEVVSHAQQHSNANDAIEALETKVGKDNDTNPNSLDFKVRALETNFLDVDEVEDLAAGLLTSGIHGNITVSYDDTNRKINLTATYDDDEVVTAVASALTAGTGISKSFDDTNNLITVSVDTTVIATQQYVNTAISNLVDGAPALLDTLNEIAAAIGDDSNFVTTITNALATKLSITDAANTYLSKTDAPEVIMDTAGALFAHSNHTNVVATYDDVNNRVNLSVIAQLTQEQAQDYIAPLFTHGENPNITATYDDESNKLILETIIPPSKAIMSASAPASPADGEFWFDTDEFRSGSTRALKVWNALTSTWEYVSSDLSLSTTNTWTSKNTFTNGIIVGLDNAPADPVHGQIYYNKLLDKLKVWDGLLWQDIQGSGGGGGGLTLIPTDESASASTFFVGLIEPPVGATVVGDLWIDVDDDAGSTEFIFTGPEAPQNYGLDTLWIDTDEPVSELIYSANEPATPSYAGELWIDLDDTSGQSILSSLTPPSPAETDLWIDLANEEGYLEYKDLFKDGAAQVQSFANLPSAALYPGINLYVASEKAIYASINNQWKKVYPNSDSEVLSWVGF